MMAFATRAVLGQRRPEASEARSPWTAALDGNGNTFWYHELTNENTYHPPGEEGRGCCFSPQLPTAGAMSTARPVYDGMTSPGGFLPPSVGCVMPADGYTSPPVLGYTVSPSAYGCPNGCTSPSPMTPAGGYDCHPGRACTSSLGSRQYHQQEQHHPVETRSPCFSRHAPGAAPQQHGRFRHQRGTRRDVPATSSSASTTDLVRGGYRWEECYRQSDGKKFWRHRETGVILKKDPYR